MVFYDSATFKDTELLSTIHFAASCLWRLLGTGLAGTTKLNNQESF